MTPRLVPIVFALLLGVSVMPAAAFDSYAFPRGIVVKGDSTGTLIQRAGQPDRIVTLENHRGAAVGERWEYYLRDKQLNFTIHDGRVARVEEVR